MSAISEAEWSLNGAVSGAVCGMAILAMFFTGRMPVPRTAGAEVKLEAGGADL
jgi:hypothetical protein